MDQYPITVIFNDVTDRYRKTDYFCPNCGCKGSVYEQQEEDYYVGHDYICVTCCKMMRIMIDMYELAPYQKEAVRVIRQHIKGI